MLLHMVVSFLLLDVTVSCKLMIMSEATRQLSRRLAFNLCKMVLFGIKLKPAVGIKFIVEQGEFS